MRRVYFDNAATTPLIPSVIEVMTDAMKELFGNPSSIHAHGRNARNAVEQARKDIARELNASIGEIFFTSGGTESNNMAIKCSVRDLGVQRIITSPLEHHCVLHATEAVEKHHDVEVQMVKVDEFGRIDLKHLEELLRKAPDRQTLVSLMHSNNEIGSVNPIKDIGQVCEEYDAYFHSDTVQSIAHFPLDLQEIPVHFISGAAHKFHGPKGVGFIYINQENIVDPFIDGGSQERNMRGGTENVYGIMGMAEAFKRAHRELDDRIKHIEQIRERLKKGLERSVPGIQFNGPQNGNYLYTVLSASFPATEESDLILMQFDIKGISVSGGSACSSGADKGSHVINHLFPEREGKTIRFSFSHLNTLDEVDHVLETVQSIFKGEQKEAATQ